MKKLIIFIPVFLCLFVSTYAQFGIKGGLSLSTLQVNDEDITSEDFEEKGLFKPTFGVYYQFSAGVINVVPELLYTSEGIKQEQSSQLGTAVVKTNINYLQLPILIKVKLGNSDNTGLGFSIGAGPFIGYALDGKIKSTLDSGSGAMVLFEQDLEFDDTDDVDRINFGLAGGAALNIGAMDIDLRYNLGLKDLSDSNTVDISTQSIALTLGYKF